MSIAVDIAMHSASGSQLTHTMPVQSTDICDDDTVDDRDGQSALRGFRKRWAIRDTVSSAGSHVDDARSDTSAGKDSDKKVDFDVGQLPVIDMNVVDVAHDDLAEHDRAIAGSKRQKIHDFERDALKNTNLQVFKYPWERGRLKKFFSNEPLVSVRTPSLKPGGRNFVGLELQVDASGRVSATTSVEQVQKSGSVFSSIVRKLDDVPVVQDRDAQRKRAIEGWWNLLAFSLVSSTIGLKVSVEATIDTVVQCAHKILDAVFAVKSPGTLMRRLYSIQSFEEWCVEKFNEHWLPVTEFRAWQYVCFLKDSNAAPTKAGSFLEALRFSWYLLGVEGSGECERSLRIKGISSQMRASKKP